MASQERIAVHNLADLKNTSDDAIPNYLNSLKFKQVHTLADTRLALGYSAFLVAAACFGWDYKFGFESTKYYTAAAVAIYAILNTALTYWIGFVEKGAVYQGIGPGGEKISIATSTTKNVPIYNVKVTITPKIGKESTMEFKKSFTEWFDSAGHFIVPPFQTMLATSVPLIATADAKRAAKSAPSSDVTDVDPALLDFITSPGSGSTTGTDAPSKKSKRRKA